MECTNQARYGSISRDFGSGRLVRPLPTLYHSRPTGEVAEWSNVPDSKSGVRVSGPWVRIPPSPPYANAPDWGRLRMAERVAWKQRGNKGDGNKGDGG